MTREFSDFLVDKDIACFAESKCDSNFDDIQGYKLFHKQRQNYSRLSGGLSIAVKTNVLPHVKIIETPSEFVLWLRVDHSFLHTSNDLIIGTCYIPPENSDYSKPEALDEIENEIVEFFNDDRYFTLLGDFNGRTKNISELIEMPLDNTMSNVDDFLLEVNQEDVLTKNGLSATRHSSDTVINNLGHRLLNFCMTCNFCILNGRSDHNSCKLTCNNKSVVDYALYHFDNFECMKPSFYIYDFEPVISDVHCAILLSIQYPEQSISITPPEPPLTSNPANFPRCKKSSPRRWTEEKALDFLMNIDINTVSEIRQSLSNAPQDKTTIDSTAIQISSLLTTTACHVSGSRVTGQGTKTLDQTIGGTADDKPWYTDDVKRKREEYHASKKRHNFTKCDADFDRMVTASKEYKRAMNNAILKYNNDLQNEIKSTRTNNPREFWKIINNADSDKKPTKIEADLDDLFNHFKNVSNSNEYVHNRNFNLEFNEHDVPNNPSLELLNGEVTAKEIADNISSLKNNRSAGDDDVCNEYLKITADLLLPIFVIFFNMILNTGIFPSSWSIGTIIPIFKGKGDPKDPKNYRPINLSSCVGKLFTALLNNRLKLFLDVEKKMNFIQGAFLPGSSTTNHLHALHSLIECVTANKKPLFCAFLDLSAAYDKVWRDGMFMKLIDSGIAGKFFNVVHSMYQVTKQYIRCNNLISNVFSTNVGIKQGCNLSCLLFALFLNDLELEMSNYGCKGTDIIDPETGIVMLKLFALLYADDTVIISDNGKDFQEALNAFSMYCRKWKLKINESKSNIIIFGTVRNRNRLIFTINNQPINIVNTFKYLGLEFNKNKRYTTAIKSNLIKGRRAAFSISKKARKLNLSVSCQIHILNTIVKPILLYGCEIFCFENVNMLNVFYVQCLKRILCLKRTTPSYMVYGETGCTPLYVDIMKRALCFYVKLQQPNNGTLASVMLSALHKKHHRGDIESKYLIYIRQSLNSIGLPLLYNYDPHTTTINNTTFSSLKRAVADMYIHDWHTTINTSHKAIFYKSIKSSHSFEPYLDILPKSKRISLTRFRLSNHKLPIESGSWHNVPLELRTCPICPLHIGDPFHYLFECPSTLFDRKTYLHRFFTNRPSVHTLNTLFQSTK